MSFCNEGIRKEAVATVADLRLDDSIKSPRRGAVGVDIVSLRFAGSLNCNWRTKVGKRSADGVRALNNVGITTGGFPGHGDTSVGLTDGANLKWSDPNFPGFPV